MTQSPEKQLFEVASIQHGYFTARQAIAVGYRVTNHPYHVKRGNWTREWRGIYRLSNFPIQPDDQYMLWSLWSCNRQGEAQGVYSFDTALNLYDVSDLMPAKLHMTVPKSFRRSSKIPAILVLHRENLDEKDYQTMKGFKVTTPLKTLKDILIQGQIEDHLIGQAANEFKRRGLITRKDAIALIQQAPQAAKHFLDKDKKEPRV